MEQPLGYMSSQNEHKICKLFKSNYGLKQTCPQLWYERFNAHLLNLGVGGGGETLVEKSRKYVSKNIECNILIVG
jgi:hypothetical protein